MPDPKKIDDLLTAELYLAELSRSGADEEGFVILPCLERDGVSWREFHHLRGKGGMLDDTLGVWQINSILTHSHPMPQPEELWSISWGDLLNAIARNRFEVRAVYPFSVYRVRRPKGGWPSYKTAYNAVYNITEEIGTGKTMRRHFERLLERLGHGLKLEIVNHGEV